MGRQSKAHFSVATVEKAIRELISEHGYQVIEIRGSLLDEYLLIAPEENQYNYYFYEEYVSERASRYKMQRFTKKMPKWLVSRVDNLLSEEEEANAWWDSEDHADFVREAIKNFR